ncbi:transposase domain-containing protein [Roseomonas sp. USHLN139]|uniref:transposase domain-containing protein n=1 Tax=Roseomonas sp. USHLN139 TaxID=3081298 RepID=UPI003FA78EEE
MEGGRRAAAIQTLVVTADLNGWNPQADLRELLDSIPVHPITRISELAPGT